MEAKRRAASLDRSFAFVAAVCNGLAFPLHEGAKRYYREIGHRGCM